VEVDVEHPASARTDLRPGDIEDTDGFALALTQLRSSVGLTIRQVAAKVGVPFTTVGGWFAGNGLPSTALRDGLIEVLRVCGVTDDVQLELWLAAWERVRRAPGRRSSAVVPYRGLTNFEPEDADWFFGRGALTDRLLDACARLDRRGGGLLLVVGASGAGKSSTLRAGAVPAIRSGLWPVGESRPVVLLTPGATPVRTLAERLADPGARPVVVVDQFEEIFTACEDEGEREAFVAALADAAYGPVGALVVLGLRADFYPEILRYPLLRTAAQEQQITVPPMTAAELREAIVGPARKAKLDIEEGFVDAVLHDVSPHGVDESGLLPLLSHALFVTWRNGRGRRLKIMDYRAAGGIRGAVAESADAVYHGLTLREKQLARRLFLSLVHIDPDGTDTRRRITRHELFVDRRDAGSMVDVVDQFVAQRLITVDVDVVKISHEALLSAWPQLATWLDADRADLLVGRQLAQHARDWRLEGRDDDGLLRGARLSSAVTWIRDHPTDGSPDVGEFLEASILQERRRIGRLRRTIAALGVLLVAAGGGGVTGVVERNSAVNLQIIAVRQRDEALSRLVATRSDQLRDKDVSLSAQLAVAAYRIAPTIEARSSLIASTGIPLADRLIDPAGNGISPAAALSPDGRMAATVRGAMLRLWEVSGARTPMVEATVESRAPGSLTAVAFTPDGYALVVGTDSGAVQLWSVADPRRPFLVDSDRGVDGTVFGFAFSADGRALATAAGQGGVQMWIVDGPNLRATGAPLRLAGGAVKSVALSADGGLMAVGVQSGAVTLWDLSDRLRPLLLASASGPTAEIGQVAISTDGRLLSAGGRDNTVYLWSIADPRHPAPLAQLTGAQSWINALAFSPDSALLAAGSSDTTVGVRIWDIAVNKVIATLPHAAPVTSLMFSANGQHLLTSANDGITRLWPVRGPALAAYGLVSSVVFSPDGNTLAVGSAESGMRLWNTADPTAPVPWGPPIPGPDSFAGTFSFTPDGHTLAVSYANGGGMQLWNTANPAHPVAWGAPLDTGHPLIESVAFSPDGHLLAAAGNDRTVELWNVSEPARPQRLAVLEGFTAYVTWVAFAPDGRTLAASSDDKTVRLWNVWRPDHPIQLGAPLAAGEHYVYCVAFSPDGRTLAASSGDSSIRLWDLTTPAKPEPIGKPLTGPTNYVYLITFAQDGRTLAAAGTDGDVWLWDVHDRLHPTRTATVTTSAGALYTVGYRARSDTLAAAGAAGLTWILTTEPTKAVTLICGATGDAISRDEWARYVPGRPYDPPC
jgi:WD40 repeat protein